MCDQVWKKGVHPHDSVPRCSGPLCDVWRVWIKKTGEWGIFVYACICCGLCWTGCHERPQHSTNLGQRTDLNRSISRENIPHTGPGKPGVWLVEAEMCPHCLGTGKGLKSAKWPLCFLLCYRWSPNSLTSRYNKTKENLVEKRRNKLCVHSKHRTKCWCIRRQRLVSYQIFIAAPLFSELWQWPKPEFNAVHTY